MTEFYIGVDDMGFKLNEDHRVRIPLSKKASIIMENDRVLFKASYTTFINTVFANYKDTAKASIEVHLQKTERRMDRLLSDSGLDKEVKEKIILKAREERKTTLLKAKDKLLDKSNYVKDDSPAKYKVYRLNNDNVEALTSEECLESQYYNDSPALYMRAVIEEYCRLPFLKREAIFRRDVYDIVKNAIKNKYVLQVQATLKNEEKPTIFYVYPYKIMPDAMNAQSFLTCYSQKKGVEDYEQKRPAAFYMSTLQLCNKHTLRTKSGRLTKEDKLALQKKCDAIGPNYLLGEEELIRVRLTEEGKDIYKSRLLGRPDLVNIEGDDIYVFSCSAYQVRHYFLDFGKEAEILSPESLRKDFQETYADAIRIYSQGVPVNDKE